MLWEALQSEPHLRRPRSILQSIQYYIATVPPIEVTLHDATSRLGHLLYVSYTSTARLELRYNDIQIYLIVIALGEEITYSKQHKIT